MYKANLSYKLLCRYLGDILDCGFVRVEKNNLYVVAPKGERFLKKFADYQKCREHLKEEVNTVDEHKSRLEQMFMSSKDGKPGQG